MNVLYRLPIDRAFDILTTRDRPGPVGAGPPVAIWAALPAAAANWLEELSLKQVAEFLKPCSDG